MELLAEVVSKDKDAPVIVLFGGSPIRRHDVIKIVSCIGDVTIYGTLSEAEGINKLRTLSKIDIVLIGGAYNNEQRKRIRAYVAHNLPNVKITEPGVHYPYSDYNIQENIKTMTK
ncbi:hypothetical protein [uncultured Croceitalea sp.]|uniref:hypothetical protein n=1 Tax=uncultured Croceitalea sp. TaxID=1798908 RepID=UPI003305C48E